MEDYKKFSFTGIIIGLKTATANQAPVNIPYQPKMGKSKFIFGKRHQLSKINTGVFYYLKCMEILRQCEIDPKNISVAIIKSGWMFMVSLYKSTN